VELQHLSLTSAVYGDEWLASCAGRFASLGSSPPVTTGLEAGCTPDLVWTVWRREHFLSSAKIRTPDRHCSYQLPRNLGMFHYNNYNHSFLVLYRLPRGGGCYQLSTPHINTTVSFQLVLPYCPYLAKLRFLQSLRQDAKPTVYTFSST